MKISYILISLLYLLKSGDEFFTFFAVDSADRRASLCACSNFRYIVISTVKVPIAKSSGLAISVTRKPFIAADRPPFAVIAVPFAVSREAVCNTVDKLISVTKQIM